MRLHNARQRRGACSGRLFLCDARHGQRPKLRTVELAERDVALCIRSQRCNDMKFNGEDEAKENEVLAAIVAVLLAGAITFIIWAVFGQGA